MTTKSKVAWFKVGGLVALMGIIIVVSGVSPATAKILVEKAKILASSPPPDVVAGGSSSVGVSLEASRGDHTHGLAVGPGGGSCVPAGTGSWSGAQVMGETFSGFAEQAGAALDSEVDCAGTLHWVRGFRFTTTTGNFSQIRYFNSNGADQEIDLRVRFTGVGSSVENPSISIDENGNIFVMAIIYDFIPTTFNTPVLYTNLTP